MDARLEIVVVGGSRMWVDTTEVAGRMLATSGVWEPHVTAVVRQLLGPGDVFVDVGANIGYFTLLGARLVGSRGRVHALEPSARAYPELVANIERNGLTNVVPERVAAGATSGEATLQDVVEGSNIGASSLRSDPERGWGVVRAVPVTVPLRMLADVVPALGLAEAAPCQGRRRGLRVGRPRRASSRSLPRGTVRPSSSSSIATSTLTRSGSSSDFARRFGLAVRRIVDRPDAERRWAARNPLLVAYDDPARLAAVDDRASTCS